MLLSIVKITMPIQKSLCWLEEERRLGSPYPKGAVLASVDTEGKPTSRIVALRQLDEQGALFFTQRLSRKVSHLRAFPFASITIWLQITKRQINLEGKINELSPEENAFYWDALSKEGQLKFSTYAPMTGQIIDDQSTLQDRYEILYRQYENQVIPVSPEYIGFRLRPDSYHFYELNLEEFSERQLFTQVEGKWKPQYLSP